MRKKAKFRQSAKDEIVEKQKRTVGSGYGKKRHGETGQPCKRKGGNLTGDPYRLKRGNWGNKLAWKTINGKEKIVG